MYLSFAANRVIITTATGLSLQIHHDLINSARFSRQMACFSCYNAYPTVCCRQYFSLDKIYHNFFSIIIIHNLSTKSVVCQPMWTCIFLCDYNREKWWGMNRRIPGQNTIYGNLALNCIHFLFGNIWSFFPGSLQNKRHITLYGFGHSESIAGV